MSIALQSTGDARVQTGRERDSLLSIGWRRKLWIAIGLLVGLGAGAGIATQMPRVYQSSAQISVVKKRPDSVIGVDTKHLDDTTSPPQDVLKSAAVIERAIHSKGLAALPLTTSEDQDLPEAIRNSLTVVPAKNPTGASVIFKLHVRTHDPEHSRIVLTALLDSYKELMDRKHQAVSADTLELILREKQALEKDIAEHDAAYRAFREKAPLLGKGKDGSELRQERLNSIQAKRSALLLQKVELQGQLTALETAKKEGRSEDVILAMLVDFMRKVEAAEPRTDRPANVQDQLFPLLLEERKLVQIHGAAHPEVIEIRKRIAVARRLLVLPPTAWHDDRALDPVKLHMELLKQKVQHIQVADDLLAGVFQTEQDEARRLASFEIQNDSFRAKSAMNQQLYEALVKRLNEVGMVRNVGGYQIELLEPPSLGKRVAPSLMLALAAGAVIGIGLGFGAALVVEARNKQ